MSETLTDLMKLAAERHDASGRRLADLAARQGLDITHTTINHILAGTYRSRPGAKTLEAVAFLAGVDLDRVYRAAGQPLPGKPFAEELPPDTDYLTPRQRSAVIEVIRAMLESRPVEAVGEVDLMAALVDQMAEGTGPHSLQERLAAVDEAMRIVARSRAMSPGRRALFAEMAAVIRDGMEQHETG